MKDEKNFKVVLKNVHPSINLEDSKQDINNKGQTWKRRNIPYETCDEEFQRNRYVFYEIETNNK